MCILEAMKDTYFHKIFNCNYFYNLNFLSVRDILCVSLLFSGNFMNLIL